MNFVSSFFGFCWIVMWVAGMVLAKGYWSTLAAIFSGGFWSLYLVVEKALQSMGWV